MRQMRSICVRLNIPQCQRCPKDRPYTRLIICTTRQLTLKRFIPPSPAKSWHWDGVPKAEARKVLLQFVRSGVVEVDPPEVEAALTGARGAGLVDRVIHARHRRRGAVTLTFERKQGALEGAQRLEA